MITNCIPNLIIPYFLAYSCKVDLYNPKWVDDWHLWVTNVSDKNYQLLRTNNVAVKSDLLMLCNREPYLIEAHCQKKKTFDRYLPSNDQCNEMDSLKPIKIKEKASYCLYDLYRVGFNITVAKRNHFLQAYQVCFDSKHKRTLFATHKVYRMADFGRDFLHFNPDDIFKGKYFTAFNQDAVFNTFKKLLGVQQPYMDRNNDDHTINRGHLAPLGDFVTTNLKRAAFKMINVTPQFKTIDKGNWALIEEWTRKKADAAVGHICTGVLDCKLDSNIVSDLHCVVQLNSTSGHVVPIFLAEDRKIPLPLWIYKIIKTEDESVVFLTLNNIYHKGSVTVSDHLCKKIACSLKLEASIKKGMTFCCSYDEFIARNVPHLKKVC